MHRFSQSLKKSIKYAYLFEPCYDKWFPYHTKIERKDADSKEQREGLDTTIYLKHGKKILIQEKMRFVKYDDIFLEIYSDLERKTHGWMAKEQIHQFIAYYIQPTGKAYLLPTEPLRKAYLENGTKWIKKYGFKDAVNQGYITRGIPVPINVLREEMIEATTYP